MSPLPDPSKPFDQQNPIAILAMCIFGEARNQSFAGMLAVGCVVRNRVAFQGRYGTGFSGVVLHPYQFSSFNYDDPNRAKLLTPTAHGSREVWEQCYRAAYQVYWGAFSDNTGGAVFYFSPPLTAPPRAWGETVATVTIGDLHFYRLPSGGHSPVPGAEPAVPAPESQQA